CSSHPYITHLHYLSFPTRRSSDLPAVERSFFAAKSLPLATSTSVSALRRSESPNPLESNGNSESGRSSVTVRFRACRRQREHRRSEEHTSELQSLAYLVCRLLLEK